MVVIDVSSSTLGFSNMIAKSLLALANDPSQRAGLVLASQSAYMALPPETPGSALRGWQRMIDYINEQNHKLAVRAKLDRTPLPNPAPGDYPWVGVFTGGTRLSTGLARAIQALREAGTRGGEIVLVSDLRDAPEDLPRVGALITRMRELGIKLRVVTVGRSTRDPREFSDIGGSAFIMDAADSVYAPEREPTLHARAFRAAAHAARHRTRGAARRRRAIPAPALGRPRRGGRMSRRHASLRIALGLVLLVLAAGSAFLARGTEDAARAFRGQQAEWQRGLEPARPPLPQAWRSAPARQCSGSAPAAMCCGPTRTTGRVSQTSSPARRTRRPARGSRRSRPSSGYARPFAAALTGRAPTSCSESS